jgi:hypothetical protein
VRPGTGKHRRDTDDEVGGARFELLFA